MRNKLLKLRTAIEESTDNLLYISDPLRIDVLQSWLLQRDYPGIKAIAATHGKGLFQDDYSVLFVFDVFVLLSDRQWQQQVETLLKANIKIVLLYTETQPPAALGDFWASLKDSYPPARIDNFVALKAINPTDLNPVTKDAAALEEKRVFGKLEASVLEFDDFKLRRPVLKPILPLLPNTAKNLLIAAYLLCKNRHLSVLWFDQPEPNSLSKGLEQFSLANHCTATVNDVLHRLEDEVVTVPAVWLECLVVEKGSVLSRLIEERPALFNGKGTIADGVGHGSMH